MVISEIINTNSESITLINEKDFEEFSRTKQLIGKRKCIFVKNKRFISQIDKETAMVITDNETASCLTDKEFGLCVVDSPRDFFFELLSTYEKQNQPYIPTVIGKDCYISDKAIISPYNVTIKDRVIIGDNAIIEAGTEIGSDSVIQGFCDIGFQDFNIYKYKGLNKQAYHSGKTVIGEKVNIGPGVRIGRALYRYCATYISDGCCLAANVMIGHNVRIGKNAIICAGANIGGFSSVGEETELYMNVVTKNGLTIGSRVVIGVGSVVIRNIPDNTQWFGNPAKQLITPK